MLIHDRSPYWLTNSGSSTIAIIGAGFSGTMVAAQLLRQSNAPLIIKLIDQQTATGRGMAYSTSWNCHVLNVPAGKMSALPDQPNHFLHWLQQHDPIATADTFAPRSVYGHYVQSVLSAAMATAPPSVRVDRIVAKAVSLQLDDLQTGNQRAIVSLSTGEHILADRVVLASGNVAASPPPIANSAFYQSKRYLNSAWSKREIAQLSGDQPVLLMGTGLTALDVVLALQQQGHRGKVHLVSRHGLLPQAHQPSVALTPDWLALPAYTARALLRQVRQQVAQGHDWRSVIDSLRPVTQQLWQSLPLVEQQRWLRHLRPYWEVHRHRAASQVADAIEQWRQTGQLVVHAGRIQDCCDDAEGVTVQIRRRSSQTLVKLRVNAVINCTGLTSDYQKMEHPLIAQLLQSGYVQPDALRLGLTTAATGALLRADGTPSSCLYTLGSPQRGRLWETTAVPELRQQAQAIAQTLLAQLALHSNA